MMKVFILTSSSPFYCFVWSMFCPKLNIKTGWTSDNRWKSDRIFAVFKSPPGGNRDVSGFSLGVFCCWCFCIQLLFCMVSRSSVSFWRGPLWMGPVLPVPTEMGQDQSGEHLPLRPSEGAGQRSLQQQCDRCKIIRMFSSAWAALSAFLSTLPNVVSNAGHFLYVTVPPTGLTNDWASFQSHALEPTNSSHPCKVSQPLYTTSFGTKAISYSLNISMIFNIFLSINVQNCQSPFIYCQISVIYKTVFQVA